MTNDWIIHVIADLEEFATSNDLPALAVQLRRAQSTAQSELSQAAPATRVGGGAPRICAPQALGALCWGLRWFWSLGTVGCRVRP
ncbi:MAG: hypothetical protein ACPG7W_07640 [Paracoccaceae bacterium]